MFEFWLPTGAKVVPDGSDWFHEIKYDVTGSASRATEIACG